MAWQRDKVFTTSRTIFDSIGPGGAPAAISPEYQPVAGVEQYWWWDRQKAAGWLDVARSMAFADAATLDAVARSGISIDDGAPALQDVVATGAPRYLADLFGAIMNYYNSVNMPWYMHNTARMLYRQYMAGTPWNYGGGPAIALFSDTQCYGRYDRHDPKVYTGSWYRPDSRLPRATEFYGSLPQQARELFLANYDHGRDHALPHPTDFAAWFTLDLQRADGEPPADDHDKSRAAYYRTVKNVVVPSIAPLGAAKRVGPPGANTSFVGWDWWSYDVQPEVLGNEVNTTGPLRASTPARAYLAWAQAWVTALMRQSPADVMTEVIAYTAYCNFKQALVIGNGSAEAFIGRALGVDGRLIAEQNRPDQGLQVAATAIAGVSAALTAVPVAGPVIAVLGGAVAAGIKLFDLSQTHAPTSVFFDDLGRPKPTIERNTLAGYTGNADADSVAELYVPDPPATGRTPLQMAMQTVRPDLFPRGSAALGDANASRNFALARATTITKYGALAGDQIGQAADAGIPLPVKVALGLGLVYGLYQLVKPKSR